MSQNPLGVKPIRSLMAQFAVPSVIAMLVGSIYNIVDQLFIGHYVGELGNAATNVAFPLTTCSVAIGLLFGIGGASQFNLHLGRGEREKAPYFIGTSTTALLALGTVLCIITLLFTDPLLRLFGSPDEVLPYARAYVRITAFGFPFHILTTGGGHLLRADGAPQMTMITSLSGAIINVGLDALFIIPLDMGMQGAALATIIGQIFSGLLVIWYLTRRFHTVPLKPRHFLPRLWSVGLAASLGMASCFNQLAMLLTQIVLNNSLRYYGGLSEYGESIPLAVGGITMKVFQLGFAFIIGISQGAQPIFSFNYGARKYDRVRRAYLLALLCGSCISITMFTVFQLFPRQLMGLFGSGSEAYFACGELFFKVFLVMTFANFLQPITANFCAAIGKPIKGVVLSLTRQVLFFIPFMLLLPRFFGFHGVLYSGPVADSAALVASATMGLWEMHKIKQLEQAGK